MFTAFKENIVLEAHPSKDTSSPWSYGKTQDGKSGWFPSNYAEEIKSELWDHACSVT